MYRFCLGLCDDPGAVYQAWAFIRPGLKKSENFLFLIAMVFGLLCFCTGAFFAYKIMLPFMLYFFNTLSIGSGVSAYISVQNYLSFLLMVLIIFGIVFELPMVSDSIESAGTSESILDEGRPESCDRCDLRNRSTDHTS
ncbi:MAG: twin-arginine translocase subunit TatC [Lachnospiraceae bacterium]